jgi:hypothetical protein
MERSCAVARGIDISKYGQPSHVLNDSHIAMCNKRISLQLSEVRRDKRWQQ